jgi:putative ABC transport system permease protein
MTLTPLGCYYQDFKKMVFALALGGDVNLDIFGDLNLPLDQREALLKRRTGAIVGRDLAIKHGWTLGSRIPLTGFAPKKDGTTLWEFDIVGIYDLPDRAQSAELFLFNYEYLEEARVSDGGSAAFIFVDTTDADYNTSVAAAIDSSFANSVQPTFTQTEREFQLEIINRAVDVQLIVNVVVMSSLFTLLFVAGNTMSRAVRERVAEFAVLRALGYSTSRIGALVIAEVQVLSLTAALLGIVTANAIFPAVEKLVNLREIVMPLSVAIQIFGIAFVVALLSSLPSVLQIRRPSIVEGLAAR